EQDSGLLGILPGDRPWYLPSIALGEYRFGVLNSTQREVLERWLGEVEAACVVLSPDAVTACHYPALREWIRQARFVVAYHDIWIAALAIQHQLAVVSRDADFDRFPGIRRISW